MKNFNLKIISKNKKTVKHFCLQFFNRKNLKKNYKLLKKCKNSITTKKVITLLKAPHVYKTAQEQFEFRNYKKNYNLLVTNYKKFLILLKKIKLNRFPDIKIQLSFKIQKFNNYSLLNNFILNNFKYFVIKNFLLQKNNNKKFLITKKKYKKIKHIKIFWDKKSKTISQYLQILDIFGENFYILINLKNLFR